MANYDFTYRTNYFRVKDEDAYQEFIKHIRNISQILPASAEQVIIAVMQKDWEPASDIMAPVVGKSYRIEKQLDQDGKEIDTISYIR